MIDLGLPAVFGIQAERILIALVIIVVSFVVGKVLYYLFKVWGRRITSKTQNRFDDVFIDIVEEPIVFILVIIGIFIAFSQLGITNTGIIDLFNKILATLVILAVTWFLIRLADALIELFLVPITAKTKSTLDDQLLPLISKGIKLILGIIALIIILSNFGINVTALIAGLGIGGIAIAFAAQKTIENIFGGVSLLMDKSFRVGDKIKLESGLFGTVKDLGIRSTKIQTPDNEIIVIPNSILANSILQNAALPTSRTRVNVDFGVVYGSNVVQVKKIALDSIKGMKDVLPEPAPNIDFVALGDFSLNFTLRFWVKRWQDVWNNKLEARKRVYEALNKAKIDFAFPTQTIYLEKGS